MISTYYTEWHLVWWLVTLLLAVALLLFLTAVVSGLG
jgi:hypothetical protein